MTTSTYSPTFFPSLQQGQPWNQYQQGHEQTASTIQLVMQLLNSAQQQIFTAQQIVAQLPQQLAMHQTYQQPWQQLGQQFGQQQPWQQSYQQFGQPYQQFWQQQQRPYAMTW